jgi:hypothetical protein
VIIKSQSEGDDPRKQRASGAGSRIKGDREKGSREPGSWSLFPPNNNPKQESKLCLEQRRPSKWKIRNRSRIPEAAVLTVRRSI